MQLIAIRKNGDKRTIVIAVPTHARGNCIVDIAKSSENASVEHCREADIRTQPLQDCLSYYNGDGNAEPGSLAYYGGPQNGHEIRLAAQESLEPYVFEAAPA